MDYNIIKYSNWTNDAVTFHIGEYKETVYFINFPSNDRTLRISYTDVTKTIHVSIPLQVQDIMYTYITANINNGDEFIVEKYEEKKKRVRNLPAWF